MRVRVKPQKTTNSSAPHRQWPGLDHSDHSSFLQLCFSGTDSTAGATILSDLHFMPDVSQSWESSKYRMIHSERFLCTLDQLCPWFYFSEPTLKPDKLKPHLSSPSYSTCTAGFFSFLAVEQLCMVLQLGPPQRIFRSQNQPTNPPVLLQHGWCISPLHDYRSAVLAMQSL